MKKICKYLICMILGVCLTGDLCNEMVCANIIYDENTNKKCESSYLDRFYEETNYRKVEDVNGNDVTDLFVSRTKSMYEVGDVESIKNIIQEEEFVLHLYSVESGSTNISTFGLNRYKNVVSDMFYFALTSDNGVTLLVESELKGGIWYDEASGQVTRTSTPTYNIIATETNTGYNITPNDFSTGSRVENGKGFFWGRCSFTGIMIEKGVVFRANFGSVQKSFWAVP